MSWKVSLEEIIDLQPIPGADLIEVASVLGWKCVVSKGEFQIGDLGVYIPLDSIVPDDKFNTFEFMRTYKFRVRTVKLRKQVSQGLLFPVSKFPEKQQHLLRTASQGEDVSEYIDVIKYEKPIPMQMKSQSEGYRPEFLLKTDQERIQNIPEMLDLLEFHTFEETEKQDGTSIQQFFNDDEFGVCGRNWQLKKGDVPSGAWLLEEKYNLEEQMRALKLNISIQGEGIGVGIQKNRYAIVGVDWRVFDIWDIDAQRLWLPAERRDLTAELGLVNVPVVNEAFSGSLTMEEILERADGMSLENDQQRREGIVFKCNEYIGDNYYHFKVVSNKFLLKNKE